jgi:gas vesicle protein
LAFLLGWFVGGVIGTAKTLAWAFAQGAKTRSAINRGNAKTDVFHKDDDLAAESVHDQGGHPPLGDS